jgi:autotransporter adhesin
VATNSVAVGAGAQAGGGGAAFGDNAVALSFDRGTALGNAANAGADLGTAVGTNASVTAANGVALGSNSTATRGGMNGAVEAYSDVAVASTNGAVSVGSANGERQITNVAGGTQATDAVNLRQLDAAVVQSTTYTDTRFNTLSSALGTVRDDSRAGVSAAMAMASMPQAVLPGKNLIAAGVGNYQGESALSVGLSALSDNGRWVLKGQATADSQGNVGVGGGVGMHW